MSYSYWGTTLIFNNEVVARAFKVREFTIERDRKNNGFVIKATFIDDPKQQLTTPQVAQLEEQLTKAVGGPITIDAPVITGVKEEYTEGIDRLRQLEILFERRIAQLGGQLIELEIKKVEAGFTIAAAVVALEDEILSSELLQIQEELSETMEAPVSIRATLLSGTRINLEPTATPALTP